MGDRDRAYKMLFGHERLIEDLLRGFLPEEVLDALDFDSLERVKTEFLAKDTSGKPRERRSDAVWKIRLRDGGQVLVYLMLEFQSTIDRWMALRVLTYTALLLEDLVRHGHVGQESGPDTIRKEIGEPHDAARSRPGEMVEPGRAGRS